MDNSLSSLEQKPETPESLDDWILVIQEGQGGLVAEVTLMGGFHSFETHQQPKPYEWMAQKNYLEVVKTREIEDFLQGKMRAGTK